MSRRLALLSLLGLGLACARPQPRPQVVKVPVATPAPPPTLPSRPALPSAQLGPEPSLEALLKALLADRELLAAWALDLETRLKAYLPAKEPVR